MEDDATDQKLKATAAITILLLGDAGCGKSTFLSRLKKKKYPRDNLEPEEPLQLLADCNQPFIYEVRFSRKKSTLKLELEFYDTASPDRHWSALQPDVVLLAFDVSDRSRDALAGLKGWRNDITRYFQRGSGECIPVMLIGFKRDLRVEDEGVIYPQEVSYYISPRASYSLSFPLLLLAGLLPSSSKANPIYIPLNENENQKMRIKRHTASPKSFTVTAMRSALLLQGN